MLNDATGGPDYSYGAKYYSWKFNEFNEIEELKVMCVCMCVISIIIVIIIKEQKWAGEIKIRNTFSAASKKFVVTGEVYIQDWSSVALKSAHDPWMSKFLLSLTTFFILSAFITGDIAIVGVDWLLVIWLLNFFIRFWLTYRLKSSIIR